MADLFFFLMLGFSAGALLGIPIGPNGSLCLYRSVEGGMKAGFRVAFGSITAIAIHSFLSVILFIWITELMKDDTVMIASKIVSGCVMILFGVAIYFMTSSKKGSKQHQGKLDFFGTFTIAFLSPKNIFGFTTFLVAQQIIGSLQYSIANAAMFSIGATTITLIYFSILVFVSVQFGDRIFKRILPLLRYLVSGMFVTIGITYLIVTVIWQ